MALFSDAYWVVWSVCFLCEDCAHGVCHFGINMIPWPTKYNILALDMSLKCTINSTFRWLGAY